MLKLRYSLKALLLAVTLCGLLFGLFVVPTARARRQRAAVRIIERSLGVDVHYDVQTERNAARRWSGGSLPWKSEIEASHFDRGLLGIDFWHDVYQIGSHPHPLLDGDADRFYRAVAALPELRSIWLRCPELRERHLLEWKCRERLEEVHWRDSHLDNEVVAALCEFRLLKVIEIETEAELAASDWSPLSRLTELEVFEARRGSVGDSAAVALGGLPSLRRLDLSQCDISDIGATGLARSPRLEILRLDDNRITDRGAEELATINTLRELWLSNNSLSAAGVMKLRSLKQLQSLRYSSSAALVDHIDGSAFPQLRELEFQVKNSTGLFFAADGAFPELRSLVFDSSRLELAGWRGICRLPKLEHLGLYYGGLPRAFVAEHGMPTTVTRLDISHAELTRDALVLTLNSGASLKEINLCNCGLSDGDVKEIAPHFPGVRITRHY